jgi:transcriptional regulator with XRE-family HTH domain
MNRRSPGSGGAPDSESIGSRVRSLRRLRRLTIKELAERTDSSMGFVSELENNPQRSMSLQRLKAFAKALEVPDHVLMGGDMADIPEEDREFVAHFVALPEEVKSIFKALMEWCVTSRRR